MLGGAQRRAALLPVIVQAFDFALGLRGGRVAQGDFVKAQRPAELGEDGWLAGEKEGMIIHGERERQQAAVIVERFEQMKARRLIRKPAVRRSIALPESSGAR